MRGCKPKLLLPLHDHELCDFQFPLGNELSTAGPEYKSSYLLFRDINTRQTVLMYSIVAAWQQLLIGSDSPLTCLELQRFCRSYSHFTLKNHFRFNVKR